MVLIIPACLLVTGNRPIQSHGAPRFLRPRKETSVSTSRLFRFYSRVSATPRHQMLSWLAIFSNANVFLFGPPKGIVFIRITYTSGSYRTYESNL